MNIKVGDVFTLELYPETRQNSWCNDPYWCFDGQLVALENTKFLYDTYWLHNFKYSSGNDRRLTVKEAQKLGELKFKCNLNEVEFISEERTKYYNENDVFNLSYQHGGYPRFAVKKGAQRDQKRMEQELERKIEWLGQEISFLERQLDEARNNLAEVRKGNLDVYI